MQSRRGSVSCYRAIRVVHQDAFGHLELDAGRGDAIVDGALDGVDEFVLAQLDGRHVDRRPGRVESRLGQRAVIERSPP